MESGWDLEISQEKNNEIERILNNPDPWTAFCDADSLPFPLEVRTWKSGDRFEPLGMEGHWVKLSDYWVNAKVPVILRGNWPLVFYGERLAWIPGQRMAHFCRVGEKTKTILCLKIKQHKDGD